MNDTATKGVILPGHDRHLDDKDIRTRYGRLQHSRATTTTAYDVAQRARGTSLTGAEPPPKPLLYGATDAELLNRAEAEVLAERAWAATDDGLFFLQLVRLEERYASSPPLRAMIDNMRSARNRGWTESTRDVIARTLRDMVLVVHDDLQAAFKLSQTAQDAR